MCEFLGGLLSNAHQHMHVHGILVHVVMSETGLQEAKSPTESVAREQDTETHINKDKTVMVGSWRTVALLFWEPGGERSSCKESSTTWRVPVWNASWCPHGCPPDIWGCLWALMSSVVAWLSESHWPRSSDALSSISAISCGDPSPLALHTSKC